MSDPDRFAGYPVVPKECCEEGCSAMPEEESLDGKWRCWDHRLLRPSEEEGSRMRPNWDEYFMGFAKAAAKRASCDRKHVGAVIVVDKQVVATGYNGSVRGMDHCNDYGHRFILDQDTTYCGPCGMDFFHYASTGESCPKDTGKGHDLQDGHCVRTIHAEMNALAQAAKHGVRIAGSTIYTTASPCWDCFRVLVNAGVERFIYAEAYRGEEHQERIERVANHLKLEVRSL